MNKAVYYGAALIGLYLVVFYASGSGTVIKSGAKGGTEIIKAFQGR
jgi:hypothetical protein